MWSARVVCPRLSDTASARCPRDAVRDGITCLMPAIGTGEGEETAWHVRTNSLRLPHECAQVPPWQACLHEVTWAPLFMQRAAMARAARCNPPRSMLRFLPQRIEISYAAYSNLPHSIRQSSHNVLQFFTLRTAILYIAYHNFPHCVQQFFT